MKMKRISLIVSLFTTSLIAYAWRPVTPPSKGDLVGVWVGYEDAYPYFYRLTLRDNNSGALVILYSGGDTGVYNLSWDLAGPRLSIRAVPLSQDTEPIVCSVTKVDYKRIDLATSGTSVQWKRSAVLLNNKELSAKIAESAKHDPPHRQTGMENN